MKRDNADLTLFLWLDENLVVTLNTKLNAIVCKDSVHILRKHTLSWL
jgi:hypothetical protein